MLSMAGLGPPLVAMQYVMYFRFYGWRVFSHNERGPADACRYRCSDVAAESCKALLSDVGCVIYCIRQSVDEDVKLAARSAEDRLQSGSADVQSPQHLDAVVPTSQNPGSRTWPQPAIDH